MPVSREQIQGVVLCGGKSTRFGSPKPFYKFEGVTLVDRALRLITPLACKVRLAIGRSDSTDWPSVALVRDQMAGIGPMGGIHAALQELGREWLLVVPVDVPFMTTEALKLLIRQVRGDEKAAVAVDEAGKLHPLCGLYHRNVQAEIEAAISRQEFGMTRLLSGMNNVRYVTFPDEYLRNVNRPEDLL